MEIAVLGAGDTARTLTLLCAGAGYDVRMHDDDVTDVIDALDAVESQLDESAAHDRIEATTGLDAAVSDADLVVETGIDDASRLQERFALVEDHTDRETLITTSQPAVSVTAAAAGLRQPARALGLQVHRPLTTPLVEIVVTDQTTRSATERAQEFASGLDAVDVVVGDTPGRATARLGLALEVEAMRLVDAGTASVSAVDDALVAGYDHAVGPLEQADRAGLDERLAALERLADALGPRFAPPALLADRVADGATGRDAGEGFYVWEDGEPTEPALSVSPAPESTPDDSPPE
jgi:3-hydroxybutyryl-CoA dehydrogenase